MTIVHVKDMYQIGERTPNIKENVGISVQPIGYTAHIAIVPTKPLNT